MENQEAILTTENTGLVRRTSKSIEERGRSMFLQRLSGMSNNQIAIREGLDPAEVDNLIRAAEDDLKLADIEEQALLDNLLETYEIDLKLQELYKNTPQIGRRRYQEQVKEPRLPRGYSAENVEEAPGETEDLPPLELGIPRLFSVDGVRVIELEEERNNTSLLADLLKERRQVIATRKLFLGARRKPEGGEDDTSQMAEILTVAQDVMRELVGDAHNRAIEEAREVGRLQEAGSRTISGTRTTEIPGDAIEVQPESEGGDDERDE